MAGVSNDYSTKCLMRSYNATQKELVATFAESSKLDLAKKAAQEAGDASEETISSRESSALTDAD
jgi:hypothetical protein